MDAAIDHFLASGSYFPALVVFQTDGGPTSRIAAERYLCKAAATSHRSAEPRIYGTELD